MDTRSFLDQHYARLPPDILARACRIKLLSLDVDGVMTAGGLPFGPGGEALKTAMKQSIYRPEMIEALGKWGEQGALGAQITANCPVYRLTRPLDFAHIDSVCEAIEEVMQK